MAQVEAQLAGAAAELAEKDACIAQLRAEVYEAQRELGARALQRRQDGKRRWVFFSSATDKQA